MTTNDDPVAAMTASLEEKIGAAEATLDDAGREAREAEVLADFGPEGRWKYAPPGTAAAALEQCRRALDTEAARAIARVDLELRHLDEVLEPAERAGREPPDLVAAWVGQRGSNSAAEYIQLCGLDVLLRTHHAAELRTLAPDAIQQRYEAALASTDLRDVGFIQAVERAHAAGTLAAATASPATAAQFQAFGARIEAVRRARIPASVARLRAVAARGQAVSKFAHDIKRLPWWTDPPAEPAK